MAITIKQLKALVKESLFEMLTEDPRARDLLKECLYETISEGLRDNRESLTESKRRDRSQEQYPRSTARTREPSRKDPYLDGKVSPLSYKPIPAKKIVANVPAEFAKDSVMSSIFADTANTTMVMQESSAAAVAGDLATKQVASMEIEDLFGEDKIDAWNKAAFAPSKPFLPGLSNDDDK